MTDWQVLLDWQKQGNKIQKIMMEETEKKLLKAKKNSCFVCEATIERRQKFCPYCGTRLQTKRIQDITRMRRLIRKSFFETLKNKCREAIDVLTLSSPNESEIIEEIKQYKENSDVENLKIIPLLFYAKEAKQAEVNLSLAEDLKLKIQELEEEIERIAEEVNIKKKQKSRIKSFFHKLTHQDNN